ncbi:hypothetical protein ACQEVC_11530 [Plantactinospora sp. CA-294935]|uniref:hypothetical protein n=1 Tax=Plantactinospora sp. CA-294935 TaxID=3240012 RepID=UPI003D91C52E
MTAMCQLYRVTAEMTDVLVSLAKATKAEGWWHAYGEAVPSWFELRRHGGKRRPNPQVRFLSLPGLLQTPDDAAAYFRSVPGLTEQEAAAKVSWAAGAAPFSIFEFPQVGTRPPEQTTIYSENMTGAIYLDKPAEVAAYDEI